MGSFIIDAIVLLAIGFIIGFLIYVMGDPDGKSMF